MGRGAASHGESRHLLRVLPFGYCPNIRPAFVALHGMGFTRLRVLVMPNNFSSDWVDKGYPVEKGL
jgi:thiosulfate/3-mercaptopyruvate sulfurtransferase